MIEQYNQIYNVQKTFEPLVATKGSFEYIYETRNIGLISFDKVLGVPS